LVTDDAVVDTAGAIAEMIDLGTDLVGRYLIDRDDLCASDHPGPNSPALPFAEAAPMACAGVTHLRRFASFASQGRRPRRGPGHGWARAPRCAVLARLGFETVAIARDADKDADARNLGAHHYIDSTAGDIGAALKALGGATVVLAAVANSKAMADTVGVIALQGELVIIGVTADPLPISPWT
jgi:alcohol dehydrogenase